MSYIVVSNSAERASRLIEPLESRRMLSAATNVEMQMLDAINIARAAPAQARALFGGITPTPKPTLVWSDSLNDVAKSWTASCVATQTFGHIGVDGSTPMSRAAAFDPRIIYDVENGALVGPIWDTSKEYIAAYTTYVQQEFIASDGHFAQMMDAGTRECGIDIEIADWQGLPCLYVFMEMGMIKPIHFNTADFNELARNFNTTVPMPQLPNYDQMSWPSELGDFNGDGKVNILDFNALASSFGAN